VQLHRDAVDAERLDRLVQVDETLLDVEALRIELLGDVRGRDGAEELALFSHASGEGELHLFELLRELGGRRDARILRRLEAVTLLRDPLQVARRRLVREATGEEVVACVSVLDRDDVTRLAQVLDRLSKDDFKGRLLEVWLIVQAVARYRSATENLEVMFRKRGFELDHSMINR